MTAYGMKSKVRATLVILTGMLLVSQFGCSSSLVSEGSDALENGDCAEAVEIFSEYLSENPQDLAATLKLGASLRCIEEYDRAVDLLSGALATDSSNAAIVIGLGLSYEGLGQFDTAETMYEHFLKAYPDDPRCSEIRGRLVYANSERIRREVDEALRNEESLAVPMDDRPTVGVLPFIFSESAPDSVRPLGRGLSAAVMYDLSLLGSIRTVERLRLNYVLEELNLTKSGLVDTVQSARLGRVVGATHLVEGQLAYADEIIALQSALVDVETAHFKPTFGAQDMIEKVMKLQKELTFAIIDSLDIPITPEERNALREIKAESFDAFLAYSFGIEELDRGNYEAANDQFRKAAALDPGYKPASKMRSKTGAVSAVSSRHGIAGRGTQHRERAQAPPRHNPPPRFDFTTDIFEITEPTVNPRDDDDPTVETGAIWLTGHIR